MTSVITMINLYLFLNFYSLFACIFVQNVYDFIVNLVRVKESNLLSYCRVSEMSFVLKSVATLISSLKRSAKEVDRQGYLLLSNIITNPPIVS
jgi:hypothetical protein